MQIGRVSKGQAWYRRSFLMMQRVNQDYCYSDCITMQDFVPFNITGRRPKYLLFKKTRYGKVTRHFLVQIQNS